MTRKTTTFRIEYYKPSGKFYASGDAELETQWLDGDPDGMPYMQDAIDAIASRRESGPLPGLTGGWHGPIRIDHDRGFPRLLLPVAKPAIPATTAGDVSTTPIGSIGP